MPSTSERQRRLMGMALSYKRGKGKKKPSGKVRKIINSMSLKQLEEYASKPKGGYR